VNYFLAKTGPETYSIDQLEREHKTVRDGVKNPQVLHAIASMRPKNLVVAHHWSFDEVFCLLSIAASSHPGELVVTSARYPCG
jgi:predicted RNA-binding protein with PUA-like domain